MRLIFRILYVTFTLLTLMVVLLPFLILSTDAQVKNQMAPDHESLITLKKTLYSNNPFNPYQIKSRQTITLSEQDVNQAVVLGTTQQKLALPTHVYLLPGKALVTSTYTLASTPFFLNTNAELVSANGLFKIDKLTIGRLVIPGFVVQALYPYALQYASKRIPQIPTFLNAVKLVEFKKKQLKISYLWDKKMKNELRSIGRSLVMPPEEIKKVQIYYNRIADTTRFRFFKRTSLKVVLQQVFKLAKERSQTNDDPVAENKAAIIALGLAIVGIRPNYIFNHFQRIAVTYNITLKRRHDLSQHYLVSATLSVLSNEILSDAIGLSKEIDDSRGISGFSFADLLADRAGTRFGELAIKDKNSARFVQALLSDNNLTENNFMPDFTNLPEAISELEFKRRYISITNPKYLVVEKELQRRIALSALFKHNS